MIPLFVIENFRQAFPEFSNVEDYTNAMINFWEQMAENEIDFAYYQNLYSTAIYLFTAHKLVLALKAKQSARCGVPPGEETGKISSKTSPQLSMSFDTASTANNAHGDDFNLTTYGMQYLQIRKLVSSGGYCTGNYYPPIGLSFPWLGWAR